ncbi:MAG: choice-of-anchor U domain-containing protein [Thermodesulfobacteriota bacterium]
MKGLTASIVIILLLTPALTLAGPYSPAPGHPDFAAVHMNDPAFIAWASGYRDVIYGSDVEDVWKTPELALGPAVGDSYHIVCLGNGGRITMTFNQPIRDRSGWDFAVFENSFNDTFLELAYVEVSSNGVNFTRFPNRSLTANPVNAFGAVDPSDIMGLASKYRQGYGTPFDLHDLVNNEAVTAGLVDINAIKYVRIIDIIGDGTYFDSTGQVIYDPYPTILSGGFDLEAIGVKYLGDYANVVPRAPLLLEPGNGDLNVPVTTRLRTDAFSDPDVNGDDGDFHAWTRWQIAIDAEFLTIVAEQISTSDLTVWNPAGGILTAGQTYYWRAKHYDYDYRIDGANEDGYPWSGIFTFSTTDPLDQDGNGVPDDLELTDPAIDLDQNGVPDVNQMQADANFKAINSATGQGPLAIKAPSGVTLDTLSSIAPESAPHLKVEESGLVFFAGIISFRLTVPAAGQEVTVIIYLSSPAPAGCEYYKYSPGRGWNKYEQAVFGPDRRSVELTLQDGSKGDADGIANGIVVDPGGLAAAAVVNGEPPPPDGAAGLGGGGCFVNILSGQ